MEFRICKTPKNPCGDCSLRLICSPMVKNDCNTFDRYNSQMLWFEQQGMQLEGMKDESDMSYL